MKTIMKRATIKTILIFNLIVIATSFVKPSINQPKLGIQTFQKATQKNHIIYQDDPDDRREFIQKSLAVIFLSGSLTSTVANASGGATAGKYTTIPIAKRRYYGRVQEGVHEFLLMLPFIVKGELQNPAVLDFFDETKTVIVEARNKSINGVCTKKDKNCKGAEIRDSRYNDMKTSMYLLGNAFRINQQKPPDTLPTVKAAKAFFKEMDIIEKSLSPKILPKTLKSPNGVQTSYLKSLDTLDVFLDLVELPPTDSGEYDKEFDTRVGASARIT